MIGKYYLIVCLLFGSLLLSLHSTSAHKIEAQVAKKPRIVVLGAGYGSLMTVKGLQKNVQENEAELILVNPHSYHYITTRLHELAAGTTTSSSVEIPLTDIINSKKVHLIQDRVKRINTEEKKVYLEKNNPIEYDYLVVGLGSSPETFGIPGMKEHAYFIQDPQSVNQLQNHIAEMFQEYKKTGKEEYLTIVIGGAGLTGIEYIGELVDRTPELCKEYDIPLEKVKVIDIDTSSTILRGFDPGLSSYAEKKLTQKEVQFIHNTRIVKCTENRVDLKNGQSIKTRTLIWTGGVRGNPVLDDSTFKTERGRVSVDPYLQAIGKEKVYVVGDAALLLDNKKKPYPPTAQVAMAEGKYLGDSLPKVLRGERINPFAFKTKGMMASLGDYKGFGMIGSTKLKGIFASFAKRGIEIRWLYQLGGVPLIVKNEMSLFQPWMDYFFNPIERIGLAMFLAKS